MPAGSEQVQKKSGQNAGKGQQVRYPPIPDVEHSSHRAESAGSGRVQQLRVKGRHPEIPQLALLPYLSEGRAELLLNTRPVNRLGEGQNAKPTTRRHARLQGIRPDFPYSPGSTMPTRHDKNTPLAAPRTPVNGQEPLLLPVFCRLPGFGNRVYTASETGKG